MLCPGLDKTLAIKTLAQAVDTRFSRIQFTPDWFPADVVGTLIYNSTKAEFTVRRRPIFANFMLTDEINRVPTKVQSALLETIQERQVTIGIEPSNWNGRPSYLLLQTLLSRIGRFW